jgi:hypothetical protein
MRKSLYSEGKAIENASYFLLLGARRVASVGSPTKGALGSNDISVFRLPFAFSNMFPQLQSTVRVHLNEVDSISDLRSLRRNDSFRNDFFLIEREHQLNFCANLDCEHRFNVAATETNLVSCRSHLRLTGAP